MPSVAEVARLQVAGREEFLLTLGAGDGVAVLLVPALFGEMNRCRRLLTDVMVALAGQGRGCALIELPGTGESLTPFEATTLDHWREAVRVAAATIAEATGTAPLIASFRGGALLEGRVPAAARWRMAPLDGPAVLRDLARAQRLTSAAGRAGPHFAGTPLAPGLAAPLAEAKIEGTAHVARLPEDAQPADVRLEGTPLWRRAEPGRDLTLAAAIAADIEGVAAACASS
jgi:hypothetical protein